MKKTRKNLEPRTIRRSAQQIWLAGLGAWALAGEEGGKLFGSLPCWRGCESWVRPTP